MLNKVASKDTLGIPTMNKKVITNYCMELHELMLCNIKADKRIILHILNAAQHYSIILIKTIDKNIVVIPISVYSKLEGINKTMGRIGKRQDNVSSYMQNIRFKKQIHKLCSGGLVFLTLSVPMTWHQQSLEKARSLLLKYGSFWSFTHFYLTNWCTWSFQQHKHGFAHYSPTFNTNDISVTRRKLFMQTKVHCYTIFDKQLFKKEFCLIVPKKAKRA